MVQIRNHHPKSEVLIHSETALNAGERGSFDGSIGSNTSKRTQRCTVFLDTRTSSRQRLQCQEGTELRKYWKDANHCFSTIIGKSSKLKHHDINRTYVQEQGRNSFTSDLSVCRTTQRRTSKNECGIVQEATTTQYSSTTQIKL